MVNLGHERTLRAVSAASGRVENAIKNLGDQISNNKDTFNSFFDARRHIDEAAYLNA